MPVRCADLALAVELIPHPIGRRLPDAPGTIEVKARLRLVNASSDALTSVDLRLHRLLRVRSAAEGESLRSLVVRQEPEQVGDTLEVSRVTLDLPAPLAPGGSFLVELGCRGPVVGYRETWPYVHDSVQCDHALLRAESFWYPWPAGPRGESDRDALLRHAKGVETARVTVRAPAGWRVTVPGGRPSPAATAGDELCLEHPPQGVVLAAGRYGEVSQGPVTVLHRPGHRRWAQAVLATCQGALEQLQVWLGRPPYLPERPLTIVEIPPGWGSVNLGDVILQEWSRSPRAAGATAAHELAHFWTPPDADRFHEALANHLEALLEEEHSPGRGFHQALAPRLAVLDDARAMAVPLVGAAGHPLLDEVSRAKGTVALALLDRLLGREPLLAVLALWLRESPTGPSDLAAFLERELPDRAGLHDFLEDWFWGHRPIAPCSASGSVERTVAAIAARYRD